MDEFSSDGLRLAAHWTRPSGAGRVPALVLVPGFPRGTGAAALVGATYALLVDRIPRETGWAAMTFTFRGTGASEGDFSIEGWLTDVRAAVDAVASRPDVTGVCIAGFRLGGTLAVVSAADDDRVRGVASFAAPASLREWVRDPAWFLEYARRTGVLRTPGFPPDPVAWTRAIANLDPLESAARMAPRPWMIDHGSDDDVVPVESAHLLASAGGEGCELRIVQHGAHRLRHDPRAIALLLGWLARQAP